MNAQSRHMKVKHSKPARKLKLACMRLPAPIDQHVIFNGQSIQLQLQVVHTAGACTHTLSLSLCLSLSLLLSNCLYPSPRISLSLLRSISLFSLCLSSLPVSVFLSLCHSLSLSLPPPPRSPILRLKQNAL